MTLRRPMIVLAALGWIALGCLQADQAPPPKLDRSELTRQTEALLKQHGDGAAASLWLGGVSGSPWFAVEADAVRPTASAIKTWFLVELFAAHSGKLNDPLPRADRVLQDDTHPAISHFSSAQRAEIRKELSGASIRRVGEIMTGKVPASNAVYNAAANLITAVLGGPEDLTRLIRARDPALTVSVRRYMLRDRKDPGDNEATAAALAALYQRLASGTLEGIDQKTMDAIRAALLRRKDDQMGSLYSKDGSLTSDPLTEVRAGWWETPQGVMVYVVMAAQPGPGAKDNDRQSSGERLEKTTNTLTEVLILAGWDAIK